MAFRFLSVIKKLRQKFIGSTLLLTSSGILCTSIGFFYWLKQRKKLNNSEKINLTKVNGFSIPSSFANLLQEIKEFPLRNGDIIVASFPKSGTTWLQEIVFLLVHHMDITAATSDIIESRFPYLEYPWPGLEDIKKRPDPRLIKTHLPLSLLPNDCATKNVKIIYIARNIKDVVTSYYFFARMFIPARFDGTMNEFVDRFIKNDIAYCPWKEHCLNYKEPSSSSFGIDKSKILFITYEDLHKNPLETIDKIAHFLGISNKFNQKDYEEIVQRCKFESMQKNPAANYFWWDLYGLRKKGESNFLRKGIIGDHVNHLNEEQIKQLEEISNENEIKKIWHDD